MKKYINRYPNLNRRKRITPRTLKSLPQMKIQENHVIIADQKSSVCSHKRQDTMCFNCSRFGHISDQCTERSSRPSLLKIRRQAQIHIAELQHSQQHIQKLVKISDLCIYIFIYIDWNGQTHDVFTERFLQDFYRLGSPTLTAVPMQLTSFCSNNVRVPSILI